MRCRGAYVWLLSRRALGSATNTARTLSSLGARLIEAVPVGIAAELRRHPLELLERRREVLDDFLGDHLRRRQVLSVGERLVLDIRPDVEVEPLAGRNLLV